MRILIVSDAWFPQINGVVRTLDTVRRELEKSGHRVEVIGPGRFRTIPCPTYPEIRLALSPKRRLAARIENFRPDAIHVATEGPLGWAARSFCLKRDLPFTTSFHTRFPEYVHARCRVPPALGYRVLRHFHRPAAGVMVAAPSLRRDLGTKGFRNLRQWSRGVDTALFQPTRRIDLPGQRPLFMFVGRIAVEKNITAFLDLPLDGTKYVVGDGPDLAALKACYPEVRFTGAKLGEELAGHFAAADAFVFPGRTDTFGLVLLEALASGVPIAAYPVTGPIDVIGDALVGVADDDLAAAANRALALDRDACRAHALRYSWRNYAEQFRGYLQPIGGKERRAAMAY